MKETRNNVISCSLIITDPVGLLAYRVVLLQQKNVSVRLQRACPPNWTAFRFWKPHAQLEKRRAHWLRSDSWFQVSQPILFWKAEKRLESSRSVEDAIFFIHSFQPVKNLLLLLFCFSGKQEMVTVVVKDSRSIKIKSSGRSANRFGCLLNPEERIRVPSSLWQRQSRKRIRASDTGGRVATFFAKKLPAYRLSTRVAMGRNPTMEWKITPF